MPERNVLLRVSGDGREGKRTLQEIGAELVKLGATEAVAKVTVATGDAMARLRELKGDLSGLSGAARIDLQTQAARAKIDDLKARIERLSALDANPKVDARIAGAVASIDRLEERIKALDAKKAEPTVDVRGAEALATIAEVDAALRVLGARDVKAKVKVDVESARADLSRLRGEIEHALSGGIGAKPLGGLLSDVAKVGAGLETLGATATTVGGKIAAAFADGASSAESFATKAASSLGSSLLGGLQSVASTVGLVLAALVVGGPIILGLVGAVGALVAVLLSAVAGAVALGVALLAAFGPVALVVAVVVSQITKATQAQQALTQATSTHKAAVIALQSANANLTKAEQAQSTQRLAAIQAEKDATLALADAQNAVANAKLGVQGAELTLQQAEIDLKRFKATVGNTLATRFQDVATAKLPGALDGVIAGGGPNGATALAYKQQLFAVQSALQGVANAELGVRDAQNSRSKAQATVDQFQSKGLVAFAGYNSALQSTAAAQRSVETSTLALARSQTVLGTALANISPAQQKFAAVLKEVEAGLSAAFEPAVAGVLSGLTVFFRDLVKFAENPVVKSSLTAIGVALGSILKSFGATVDSKGFEATFATLARGGASLVGLAGKILPDLLRFFLAIAKDALPSLLKGGAGIAASFHGFVDAELNGSKLKDQIHFVLSALKDVGHFGGAAIALLAALFPKASKTGQTLVERMTALLERWTAFLDTKKGQDSVSRFFSNAIDSVRTLYNLFVDIAKVIKDLQGVASVTGRVVGNDSIPTKDLHGGVGGAVGAVVNALGKVGAATTVPFTALAKLLGLKLGADGGIATGPVIAGEAGHEALIPLRADVLGRLGAAIAAFTPSYPSLTAGAPATPRGASHTAGDRHTAIHITAPGGQWPDMGHALAVIDQRLNAVGA